MNLRRGGARSPFKVLLVLAGAIIALTAAITGSAGSATVGTPHTSCPTGPPSDGGRVYCVVMNTYNGFQAAGGQKIDFQIFNYDQNTLTNPVITVHPIAAHLNVSWSAPKPLNANCVDGANAGDVVCTIPNVPGLGAGAKNPSATPIPGPSLPVTLYFQSALSTTNPPTITDPATLSWTVSVRVNEGPSGDPNTSVRTATGDTLFGTNSDSPQTIALPGAGVLLGTTNTGKASLRFSVPGGASPYETSLTADDSTDFCLDGLSCYPLELVSSVTGSTGGLLIWHFFAIEPSFNKNTAKIIHIRDGAATTANATANTIAGDFRGFEGARISGGTGFDGDYWVRNPTSSSFQISVTKTGPIFDIPGTGTLNVTAAKIDTVDTRDEDCKTQAGTVTTPSLWAESVDADNDTKKDDVELWFCDNSNGNVGPWG